MPQVRFRLLPLALALGVVGLLGAAWLIGGQSSKTHLAGPSVRDEQAIARVVWFETATPRAEASEATVKVELSAARRFPVAELPASDAAQFATLCEIRLLAADTELDLSHREWAALASVFAQAQAVRLAYEAEIAAVAEIAPGRWRVEIPAYAAAGDELRRRFVGDLRERLGSEVAGEVMDVLGRRLEGSFAGFGVSSQLLEVTGDPARAPFEVKVERTAHFWNSVEGSERVTTRRDVSFATAAEAAGEGWSPLLARLNKAD